MEKSLSDRSRRFSTGQMMVGGLLILVAAFLIIGSLNDGGSPETSFGIQQQSFLVLAMLSFTGGLLSFASPCTLPILPAYFAFAFQSGRRQIATNTLAFLLGLATMFSLLGAGASAIGRLLNNNVQLLMLVGGSAIILFGVVSFLGGGFQGFQTDDGQERSTTLGGSFLFGITFAVGWSSCVGPILGAVLTLAATTGAVSRGIMLLFIYALGLGLPLLVVSTLFGRASRKSLFWRILRGKGWEVNVHSLVIGVIWALAIWRILVATAQFAFFDPLSGNEFTAFHEFGLLAITLAGGALWAFTSDEGRRQTLQLHSTQMISGVLFIALGLLLISGQLATFNQLIPVDLALWFADFEELLVNAFSGG
jgi:cytochrome c-type biogenesis protein